MPTGSLPGIAGLAAALGLALSVGWLISGRRRAPIVESELISNLSHEMRTPLNGILGLTQVLIENRSGSEEREILEMVKASGESLLRVLNDLLDFSKIQAGRIRLESNEFRLRRWVRQSVALHAPQVHRKGLQIAYWVAPDVPDLVIGDSQRLRQVLWNLIANAIKFTEEGEILVEVQASPGAAKGRSRLRFSVADTGVGIPPGSRSVIFGAFAQGENAKPEQGGLGLGLAISNEIVGRMGGAITVESEPSQRQPLRVRSRARDHSENPPQVRRSFPARERSSSTKALAAGGHREGDAAPSVSRSRARLRPTARLAVEELSGGRTYSFLLLDSPPARECSLPGERMSAPSPRLRWCCSCNTHQRVPPEVLRSHDIAGTLTKPVAPTHLVRAIEIREPR